MPLDPTPLVSKTPVIPVLTIERAADAVPLARALVAGGLAVIEVTLRTKAALDAIKAIAAQVPECIVGVGTVTRVADIAAAITAGAKYLVLTHLSPPIGAEHQGPFKIPGGALTEADYRKAVQESGFTGNTVVGTDLAAIRLPAK